MKALHRIARPLLAALALALPLATAHAQTEIKLGHVGEPGSLFQQSADEFAKRANNKLGRQGQGRRVRIEPTGRRQGDGPEAQARHA